VMNDEGRFWSKEVPWEETAFGPGSVSESAGGGASVDFGGVGAPAPGGRVVETGEVAPVLVKGARAGGREVSDVEGGGGGGSARAVEALPSEERASAAVVVVSANADV
jgi:hypothetical protein